jgi:hypothetical protein
MQLKALLTALVLGALTFSAKADISMNAFTVNGTNLNLGKVYIDTVGGAFADNTVQVKFLLGASSGSLTATSPTFTMNVADQGWLNGTSFTITSGSLIGGGTGFYQMVAWQGGSDYGVGNTRNGASEIKQTPFGGFNGSTTLPSENLNLHNHFAITSVAVPEPATLALGLFGAAGLFIRRRK